MRVSPQKNYASPQQKRPLRPNVNGATGPFHSENIMTHVYELVIEDMTTLGPMGSRPTVKSAVPYSTLEKAQDVAVRNYGDKITWSKQRTHWSSGDLRYVMYSIYEIEVS